MLHTEQILQERYQLKQQLGKNVSRQTWLALDLAVEPRESVIVKLLPFSPQTHWDDLKLFEREAQVLKHLNHPRIPRYRDYFAVDKEAGGGLPWFALVQDYIAGSSLQQLLTGGLRFTQAQAKEIAAQLLNILVYLHELSPPVLHRDIKPSNIIQDSDGQIYLVDFGAVQEKAKAEGVTFTVVGTGGYAPPEQLWGRAVSASDLYALGATVIHLLTGTSPANLPQHRMRLQFQDKVTLTPSFAHWLEKLTDPAPERRFSQARQALSALQSEDSTNLGTTRKVGFGRIGGLALLQYAAVFVCIIALPAFAAYRYINEGKLNLGAMSRAQMAYYLEWQTFSESVEQLGVGIKNPSENYEYSIDATPFAVIQYATPRKKKLKGYVAVLFPIVQLDGRMHCEEWIKGLVCETQSPGTTRPAAPIVRDNFVKCAPNTKLLNGDKPIPITKVGSPKPEYFNDDNWYALYDNTALAYKALSYAAAGEYDQALKVAHSIKDDSSKKMALEASARYKKSH
ncbi:protein kinase domain-containing protein [Allocoleopsis sp.]|uniref:protein kinase domain-containing protein n=1 Tax=Allocoleopsis sp. TaxID=3088169 RepID=UPI002FCF1C95